MLPGRYFLIYEKNKEMFIKELCSDKIPIQFILAGSNQTHKATLTISELFELNGK